jgi:glycopeptide antibiotics resistance protein
MDSSAQDKMALGIVAMIILIAAAVALVPFIFYLLTLQKSLKRCSLENRAMEPGMVWLMFIPLFNLVWHFFMVNNIAKSLALEFQKRGIAEEPKPGYTIGLTMCILGACSIIPILGALCSLGAFVCWIIYWIKISGFSAKISQPSIPAGMPIPGRPF